MRAVGRKGPKLTCIVARAADGTIGHDNAMPWHIPADLRRFKALTMGAPMIMGRKTFDSLPGLLPGRRHIVLTRDTDWEAEEADVVHSVEEALASVHGPRASIIGGAEIFALFLPLADRVEITEVHEHYGGDTQMPFPGDDFTLTMREDHPATDKTPAYSFITLERTS